MSQEEWDMIMSCWEEYCSEDTSSIAALDEELEDDFSEEESDEKFFNSLVKHQQPSRLLDCTKIGFCEIKHNTQKAILFDLYHPDTGEVYEQWLPIGVLSNMSYAGKTVWIWNNFAQDNLKDWYEHGGLGGKKE